MSKTNYLNTLSFIENHLKEIENKKVLLRASLNAPQQNDKITNSFRTDRFLKTIKIISRRAKSVFIIAHTKENLSLLPVYKYLKNKIPELQFVDTDNYFSLKKDGIYLFENLRHFKEEKENNKKFAKKLAQLADIFVQDAFAVLHREHASVISIPKFIKSFAGPNIKYELKHAYKLLDPPENSAFVLGGSKLSSKEKLLKKFIKKYSKILLVGALANEALASKGLNIGQSFVDDSAMDNKILENPKLVLPHKYTLQSEKYIRKSDGIDIKDDEKIVDAFAPDDFLKDVDFLLWNGPFGIYEQGFIQGSASFAEQIKKYKPKAYLGGGDSSAVVDLLGISDLFEFRSTGGGALLSFLANESLPGLDAILN